MSFNSRRAKSRMSAPFMFAFRDAHRARDAKLQAGESDNAGHVASASRHAALSTISEAQLRGELMRDLDALLNTTNLDAACDGTLDPALRGSIINYGLPDVVQVTIDENRAEDISKALAEAIVAFEPRLLRDSVVVLRDQDADMASLAVRFNVSAEISCEPVSLPIEFIADLEVASGRLAMRRR